MPRQVRLSRARSPRLAACLLAALACLSGLALVAVAVGKTFTLNVAARAQVRNIDGVSSHEAIVVTARGFAVYTLTGDSVKHPKCTAANGCLKVWQPVKAASAKALSKAPGIKGTLAVWHRAGFLQVTLAGHPLYTFVGDRRKDAATGEGIRSFGGIWHVSKGASANSPTASAPTSPPTAPTTPTPPPTTTPYPPGY